MPGQSHDRLDLGPAAPRSSWTSDERRPTDDGDHRIVALEKQIASQRRLSDLLEAGSPARAKSDAICRDMVETLDRLLSQGMRRLGH